jgi:flagellar M-ring protein FliF
MSFVDRIRALPVVGQIALAGVTALLIVALLVGAWLVTRPKYEVLFRDLRPADAATIIAQLEKDKTPYRLDDGGATILAPAARIDETRLAIMGADLPLKGTVGFELFNKSDMGLTEFAQRINYQRALQGELARTIMTIDAVDTARVHLTLPEPSIFRADRKPAKASVTVTTRPGRTLTQDTVTGIQRLVGASVPDLEIGNVVVLNAQGALVAGAPVQELTINASATVQQTRAIEQFYAGALRRALEPLYPGVHVVVLVPVDQWAADGESARETALNRWNPNGRDFRLQIEVSAPRGLEEAQRDDIGRIVQDEIGWSAERGDALSFADWTAEAPAAAPPEAVAAPSSPAPEAISPRLTPKADLSIFGWAAAVAIALVALVLILARRGQRPKALSNAQREAYVRRLKRLLAEDGGHAS